MSDGVQLEERSGKSKVSKQSKKSSQKQNVETSSKNKSNNDEQNSSNDNSPASSQPVLSTRAYLEQYVTPVVQQALLECAKKRPNNPLEFVGNYILERAHGK